MRTPKGSKALRVSLCSASHTLKEIHPLSLLIQGFATELFFSQRIRNMTSGHLPYRKASLISLKETKPEAL